MEREQVDMDEIREILGDIVEQDKRAGEVIRRLRGLLQKGEAQHQVLCIEDVVLDVLRLMRSDLINHGVAVRTRLAPDAPAVAGDRVQLQQVLMNLVMNACDAMVTIPREARSVEVLVTTEEGRVQVSVIDTGAGFPPECGERLFEPFFTTKTTGMGLGLAVCRTIVRSHGGEIWAERNPPGGAILRFSLPAIAAGGMP
jgi:C4-dicarboxylate-specific signal transduction histidine kinase